jgi:hypothetical protein
MSELNRGIMAIEMIECKPSFCLDCLKAYLLTIFAEKERHYERYEFLYDFK